MKRTLTLLFSLALLLMQACQSKPEPEPTPTPTVDPVLKVSAPSRWAIYQQIMKRSGESVSFDAFLTYDAKNRKTASQSAQKPTATRASQPFSPTAPPVIVR